MNWFTTFEITACLCPAPLRFSPRERLHEGRGPRPIFSGYRRNRGATPRALGAVLRSAAGTILIAQSCVMGCNLLPKRLIRARHCLAAPWRAVLMAFEHPVGQQAGKRNEAPRCDNYLACFECRRRSRGVQDLLKGRSLHHSVP